MSPQPMPLPIRFHNSLTGQLEPFEPITPGQVKLYVCGPTVYDDAHLGHARCYITWDVLFRFLQAVGYDVTYARNVTDVDDKILQRAAERGQTPQALAEAYLESFLADMDALNVLHPTVQPKATEFIDTMKEAIQAILEKDLAYVTPSGNVYFRVSRWATHLGGNAYGQLSGRTLDPMKAGARVEPDPEKEHPADFALWKATPTTDPLHWPSPWTPTGRPGWHIECSAMIHEVLGNQIDLHCGGDDLKFPHHENEIAQSEAWTGCRPFVRTWLHNGFVNVGGEKMSKSLGNFTTVRQLLEKYDANTVRYFLLQHHYRMPVDFQDDALAGARQRVEKLLRAVQEAPVTDNAPPLPDVLTALANDLNTAQAIAAINVALKDPTQRSGVAASLALLGFDLTASVGSSTTTVDLWPDIQARLIPVLPEVARFETFQALHDYRQQARDQKNWALADQIRTTLQAAGFDVQDAKDGWTCTRV